MCDVRSNVSNALDTERLARVKWKRKEENFNIRGSNLDLKIE